MHPEIFLNSSFDAIFSSGDSEIAILDFIQKYNPSCNPNDLRGLNLIREHQLYPTSTGTYISPDEWGISSKEDSVPINEYLEYTAIHKQKPGRFTINISRGCPFKCEHCLVQNTEGHTERRRSIDNLKSAIETVLMQNPQTSRIKFWAANFTLNPRYVRDLCNMMIKYFPNITWECATRLDLLNHPSFPNMLNQMYCSGCRQISLGIEGLHNDVSIQTSHQKDFTLEQIAKQISSVKASNISVKSCLMLGVPKQTRDQIIELACFCEVMGLDARPTIYSPYQDLRKIAQTNLAPDDLSNKTPQVISNLDVFTCFDRKTCSYHPNIPGVSQDQLEQLVHSHLKDFRQILGTSYNEVDHYIDQFNSLSLSLVETNSTQVH